MKLRLLNGAHTFIALFGQLADATYVHDVVAREDARRFLELFWDLTEETLRAEFDFRDYRSALSRRFLNAALLHLTSQIVTDTSQKLPQRILAPLIELKAAGRETRPHSFVVALWMHFLSGVSVSGRAIEIDDPLHDTLCCAALTDDIDHIFNIDSIFPPEFASSPDLRTEVKALQTEIAGNGLDAALVQLLQATGRGREA